MRFKHALLAILLTAFCAHAEAATLLQPGEISDRQADAALKAAEARAVALNAHVCIAVVDASGVLKLFYRMEGAAAGCADSAILKARAAATYRIPTLNFMKRVNNGEPGLVTLPGMVPLGGGVPAKTEAGIWLGAVGAAGSLNPNEVEVATAGADALIEASKP